MKKYNLKGKVFGKLKVISLARKNKWKKKHWICRCTCGNKVTVRCQCLINGITKSCGCLRHLKTCDHPAWKGYERISGNYFYSMKKRAEIKEIPFEITINQMWETFIKQKGKCSLTGIDLKFAVCDDKRNTGTASLDRIDSNKGYTKQNIQWVHKDINKMKMDLSMKNLFKYCKLICVNRKLL